MKGKHADFITSERQPLSEARNELFIVLEYLKEYAYDEKHAAKQTDIVEYAQEHYGMTIRRERISQILIHLAQLTQEEKDFFPMKVGVKPIHKINRYYLKEGMLNDQEILDLVSSIRSDRGKTNSEAQWLEERCFSALCGKKKAAAMKEELDKTKRLSRHIDERLGKLKKYLQSAIKKKTMLQVFIVSPLTAHFSAKRKEILDTMEEEGKLRCYVYQLLNRDKTEAAILYFPRFRAAASVSLSDIEILDWTDVGDWGGKVKFRLEGCKEGTIDEWVKNLYTGQTGYVTDIIIRFRQSNRGKRIRDSLKRYYSNAVTFIEGADGLTLSYEGEGGTTMNILAPKGYTYAKIRTNLNSFMNWFLDDRNIMHVQPLAPMEAALVIDKLVMTRLKLAMMAVDELHPDSPKKETLMEELHIRRRKKQPVAE